VSGILVSESTATLCTQEVLFAGRPVLIKTNAYEIAQYVSDFFPSARESAIQGGSALAEVTLMVREGEESSSEDALWFRAMGHFAVARFTRTDALWFNLRTREVFGEFSPMMVHHPERWKKHILPALLGILAPAIDVAPVHAACLGHRAGGILLTGYSGTGKSTLTISLAKRGYSLLSDDWTYLSADDTRTGGGSGVEAWGIPVPVKLLPDARRFFPELQAYRPATSLNGEMAYEVSPEECFGLDRLERCRVACIFLLERSEQRGCRIERVETEDGIARLVGELEPFVGSLASCYERQIELIHRLAGTPCYRVSFNDPPDTVAEALEHILSSLD
jgi:hypothetical protein